MGNSGIEVPESVRKAAVQKFLNRGSRSASEMAKEVGFSTYSLYQWSKRYGSTTAMNRAVKRSQDWSAEEKLEAVVEFGKLPEQQQGEFLRRQGLHAEQIEQWRIQIQNALDNKEAERLSRAERVEATRRIQELERELRRKDKALAETTALLVLQKKAREIFGSGEDE
jgi:transposase